MDETTRCTNNKRTNEEKEMRILDENMIELDGQAYGVRRSRRIGVRLFAAPIRLATSIIARPTVATAAERSLSRFGRDVCRGQ